MKNYTPYIIIWTLVIAFVIVVFWAYGNHSEMKALCNERGGVLVSAAEGFEEYICIDKQSVIGW